MAWGDNFYGQTGTGGTADVTVPTVISASVPNAVGTGQNHTCTVTAGSLSCWGQQQYGALGNGVSTAGAITSPTAIGSDTDWLRVDTGTQHTCALKTSNALWCWGGNGSGQVGTGATSTEELTKFQVGGP